MSRGRRIAAGRRARATRTGAASRAPRVVFYADDGSPRSRDRSPPGGRVSAERRTAVVVGAGAMGAAAARVPAGRGWGVALVEQHAIGHDLGGSGHDTRSFRLSHSDADD